MDSPILLRNSGVLAFIGVGNSSSKRKESDVNATTVAVDLAKSVFKLAVADEHWRIVETQRLTRPVMRRLGALINLHHINANARPQVALKQLKA